MAFSILTWLTLIFGTILVVVLAISLILILAGLRKIGRVLGQIAAGLETVEGHTAPLETHISEINKGAVSISQGLTSVHAHLSAVGAALDSVVAVPVGGAER